MAFWTRVLRGPAVGVTPNLNPSSTPPTVGGGDYTPGDPHGVEMVASGETETRALPFPQPSGWDGWPASWSVPQWDFGSRFNELVDVAWTCLDLNASVLSAMPQAVRHSASLRAGSRLLCNRSPALGALCAIACSNAGNGNGHSPVSPDKFARSGMSP